MNARLIVGAVDYRAFRFGCQSFAPYSRGHAPRCCACVSVEGSGRFEFSLGIAVGHEDIVNFQLARSLPGCNPPRRRFIRVPCASGRSAERTGYTSRGQSVRIREDCRLPREPEAGLGTSYHSMSSTLPQLVADEVMVARSLHIETRGAALDGDLADEARLHQVPESCYTWWPSRSADRGD